MNQQIVAVVARLLRHEIPDEEFVPDHVFEQAVRESIGEGYEVLVKKARFLKDAHWNSGI